MTNRRLQLWQGIPNCEMAIQPFASGRTFAHDELNMMVPAAVEHQFEIIGEATRRLVAVDSTFATRFDQSSDVISFENMIAHGYHMMVNRILRENH